MTDADRPRPRALALRRPAHPVAPPALARRARAALALGALAIGAWSGGLAGCARAPEGEFFGVRLGLSASDTRARFRPAGEGAWQMVTAPAPALEWSGSGPGALPQRARFEFHQGMLVAARYEVPGEAAAAKGRALEVTPSMVIARRVGEGGGVRVVVLSRACPEHAGEVNRLLVGADS